MTSHEARGTRCDIRTLCLDRIGTAPDTSVSLYVLITSLDIIELPYGKGRRTPLSLNSEIEYDVG